MIEEKATSVEMLICEAEEWASEVEWAFQKANSHANAIIKEVVISDKKLKHASMACLNVQVNDQSSPTRGLGH